MVRSIRVGCSGRAAHRGTLGYGLARGGEARRRHCTAAGRRAGRSPAAPGHANVIDYGHRPFIDVGAMDQTLWDNNWTAAVNPWTLLVCVGHLAMRAALNEDTWQRVRTMPGRKELFHSNRAVVALAEVRGGVPARVDGRPRRRARHRIVVQLLRRTAPAFVAGGPHAGRCLPGRPGRGRVSQPENMRAGNATALAASSRYAAAPLRCAPSGYTASAAAKWLTTTGSSQRRPQPRRRCR